MSWMCCTRLPADNHIDQRNLTTYALQVVTESSVMIVDSSISSIKRAAHALRCPSDPGAV